MDQTHTVTVHIKALREKLKDPVKSPYFIQTVWCNIAFLLLLVV
nr:helix-turn-helix domain-containing protein [Solibacillus merdavium]